VSVIIRSACPGDAPAIVEFNMRLARETEDKQLDPAVLGTGVATVLADASRGRYFVAERDDEVVGQLMITYEWSDWRNSWIWWLQSVYVRADQRGQGIFRSLFTHALQQARAAGQVVGVRLYVEKNNYAAQVVYKNLGFEEMHFNLMGKAL
jgi:ribosomal protein S18 acetylase RimI-like enzyme